VYPWELYTPDCNGRVTASLEETAGVWNTKTGERLCTLVGHADRYVVR